MVLESIKEFLREKLDVNLAKIKKFNAVSYIEKLFTKSLKYYKISREHVDVLRYYVLRDFIGLENIEPLMMDNNLEDISCDGAGIPLYVYHRNPLIGSVRTNIIFPKKEELDSFVSKLAERCGNIISVAKPLFDGSLPDGSRVQATLGSDIARRGSNFTVRMFTEKPLTPVDMMMFGTSDLRMMSYLWFLIEHGASILVCGGTASGKTSFLNILSLFIKPQMKIVSIEDTAELKLPHAHWVPEVARTPISEEGKVDMFELLRESLRQRPDYIIVGEVRGKEAYVLFQQMAVGHPGLSTLHAENFTKLVDRLTSPPINLSSTLIENLDLVIFMKRVKQDRIYKRRISTVTEILGYDRKNNYPVTNDIFEWNPRNDSFDVINSSAVLKKISETTGMTERDIKNEIKDMAKVLESLCSKRVTDYRKIGEVLNLFYNSPDFLLERIEIL